VFLPALQRQRIDVPSAVMRLSWPDRAMVVSVPPRITLRRIVANARTLWIGPHETLQRANPLRPRQ